MMKGDSDVKKLVSVAFYFMKEKKDVISHPVVSYHNEPRLKVGNAEMKERNPILVSGKPKTKEAKARTRTKRAAEPQPVHSSSRTRHCRRSRRDGLSKGGESKPQGEKTLT